MKLNRYQSAAPQSTSSYSLVQFAAPRLLLQLLICIVAMAGSGSVLGQIYPVIKWKPDRGGFPNKLHYDNGQEACKDVYLYGFPQTCAPQNLITYNEPINFVVLPGAGPGCNVNIMRHYSDCTPTNPAPGPHIEYQQYVYRVYYCLDGRPVDRYTGRCADSLLQTSASCPVTRHPVHKTTGWKYWTESDFSGSIEFRRFYTSRPTASDVFSTGLGKHWRHSFSRSLMFTESGDHLYVVREDGTFIYFSRANSTSAWTQSAGSVLKLVSNGTGFTIFSASNDTEEYNDRGQLTSITAPTGKKTIFTYADQTGMLVTATDQVTGRSLTFTAAASNPYAIASVTDSTGLRIL